jgi:hypothetical protein
MATLRETAIVNRARRKPGGLLDRLLGISDMDEQARLAEEKRVAQENFQLDQMKTAFLARHGTGVEFLARYGDEADMFEQQADAQMVGPLLDMLRSPDETLREYAIAELRELDNSMIDRPGRVRDRIEEELKRADEASIKALDYQFSNTNALIAEREKRLAPYRIGMEELQTAVDLVNTDVGAALEMARIFIAKQIQSGVLSDQDRAAAMMQGTMIERIAQTLESVVAGGGATEAVAEDLIKMLTPLVRRQSTGAQTVIDELDARITASGPTRYNSDLYNAGMDRELYQFNVRSNVDRPPQGEYERLAAQAAEEGFARTVGRQVGAGMRQGGEIVRSGAAGVIEGALGGKIINGRLYSDEAAEKKLNEGPVIRTRRVGGQTIETRLVDGHYIDVPVEPDPRRGIIDRTGAGRLLTDEY